jgi:hypothetical protein
MLFSIIIDKTQHSEKWHSPFLRSIVMLNVIYADCHLCWVWRIPFSTYISMKVPLDQSPPHPTLGGSTKNRNDPISVTCRSRWHHRANFCQWKCSFRSFIYMPTRLKSLSFAHKYDKCTSLLCHPIKSFLVGGKRLQQHSKLVRLS